VLPPWYLGTCYSTVTKTSVKEIVLPRRPPKNYEVSLSDGGDCGACAVAGLLQISIEQAYEYHVSGEYLGGKPIPKISAWNRRSLINTLEGMTNDLDGWRALPNLVEHVVSETPLFPFDHPHGILGLPYGLTSWSQFSPWCDYVRAMLNGGYYGLTTVFNNGVTQLDNTYGETNHWVTIVGWRYAFTKREDLEDKYSGSYSQEVLIANSAKNSPLEEWICAADFLKKWGGFSAIWAKPKQ
jgi:hypothetical protein